MVSFHVVFEFAIAALAALISLGAAKLFLGIRDNRQSIMTKFKLKSDQTYHDFAVFFIAEIMLLGTFLIYVVAGSMGKMNLLSSARVLLVLFLSIIAYGVLRMWVRSR